MKVNKQLAALAGLAVALSAVSETAVAASNDSGFYLGGGAGYAYHLVDCPSNTDCSNSDIGFKAFAGYQFSPNFAIEGAYIDIGKPKATARNFDASLSTSSFTVAGVGLVPMGSSASFLAKAGMHFSKTKFRKKDYGSDYANDDSHVGLLLGVGTQFKFTDNLLGRVEWEWLSQANRISDSNRGDAHLISASLMYKF